MSKITFNIYQKILMTIFRFNPNPTIRHSFWTQVVGGTFLNMTMFGANQTIIQKFVSVKKLRDARKYAYFSSFIC